MLAVNENDSVLIKRYIHAIFAEFPQLNDAKKYARLVGVNIDAEIDKALSDMATVQNVKFLVLAMAKELNNGL